MGQVCNRTGKSISRAAALVRAAKGNTTAPIELVSALDTARINRYYGTTYTVEAIEQMEEARVRELTTIAEIMSRGK